ncbi:putative defender against cell death 1 [Dioszegia hungarica]|uniref:Dolichyl-diphosphooligosaccharide--protein glycosyltransferase subunit OST2 n=1 Tax=Dioszegia hungarica TaxID=4972 RepID=A0AA38LS76_9TREE|nr:putative defender against cell death 1 [Dioszegia hungarica]KAI9633163.1 putative defender against cell death 1 [Dioszegia hungarica]
MSSSSINVPKIPSAAETKQQAAEVQSQLSNSLSTLVHNYASTTPARVKLIDSFLLFCVLSGVLQFAYRILVTSFPYYAFVGGFGSTVGQFVLLAGLRAQVAPGRDSEFKAISQERAFLDFAASSVILHLFCFNFLG